jgi:hypothetical protein
MILDPKLTGQLPEVIGEGAYYGMQTFDQHLLKHLVAGRITMESAMRVATSPHDFKLMVAASGEFPAAGAKPAADGPGAVDEIVEQTAAEPTPETHPATLAEEPAYAPVRAPESPAYEAPAGSGDAPAAPAAPPAPPVGGAPSSPPPPSAPPPSF